MGERRGDCDVGVWHEIVTEGEGDSEGSDEVGMLIKLLFVEFSKFSHITREGLSECIGHRVIRNSNQLSDIE